ncbi:uncharacterized protein LOC117640696 [Thrips palmi]|uniref:Uncharacterized protein LOC117640696 n=1 Tax=Thrips palmi TaxID=161013 RepID=A0A6P8Y9M0_THRPL|nr:uncharacterized protein LOC117640696 [Thrips palmi]
MTRGRSGYPVTKLMTPEVGKWVTVNVNGNSHHVARILISPYTVRQFENLLSHLTEKLKPPFGAVWRLFTEAGVEVKDLDEIESGENYIASGRSRPMFPIRMGVKAGRRRDGRDGRERELRSHSAVGSLGGGGGGTRGGGGAGAGGARAKGAMLDAASDTNVKQHAKYGPASAAASQPPRRAPAPRRSKARTKVGEHSEPASQVWDHSLHNQQRSHYQQPISSAKRRHCPNKARHDKEFASDEETGAVDRISCRSPERFTNQITYKV